MTFKKNFPPEFAQCVLKKNNTVASINGLDYDLILWLNYHCSYEWDMNKSLTSLFLYTDIKKDFKKSLNTNSVQTSLAKIDGMEFEMNYLESYGSKTKQSYVPFVITILIDAVAKKSYGFEVTVDKTYISLFTKPSPKVTLEYSNTTILTQPTYKKLYLLLRDALGKNTSTTRIIYIDDLRSLLNIGVSSMSNTKVVNTIKKAIKAMTDNTNVQATCIVEKKLTKNGSKEINKVRFRLYKQAIPQKTIKGTQIVQVAPVVNPTPPVAQTPVSNQPASTSQTNDKETEEVVSSSDIEQVYDEASEINRLYEEFVDMKVDLLASKRSNIGDSKSWKKGTKENLMDDKKTIDEFDVVYELYCQKNKLRDNLPPDDNQYMIALVDSTNTNIRYFVNDKYQIIDLHLNIVVDKVENVYDFFLERYNEMFYWDIMSCSNLNTFKLMAF